MQQDAEREFAMQITQLNSNNEIMKEVGQRLRDVRIAFPLTRAELAAKSGVSERTIANLESGRDVTFGNIVNVMRALSLADNLDSLVPEQGLRPSDLASMGKKRQRATSAKKGRATTWVWGDES